MTINSLNRTHIIYVQQYWTGQLHTTAGHLPVQISLWGTSTSAKSTFQSFPLLTPTFFMTQAVLCQYLFPKGSVIIMHLAFSWFLSVSHRHQTACIMDDLTSFPSSAFGIPSYFKGSALSLFVFLFGCFFISF